MSIQFFLFWQVFTYPFNYLFERNLSKENFTLNEKQTLLPFMTQLSDVKPETFDKNTYHPKSVPLLYHKNTPTTK